ncbi:MAG: DotA/TraY family protein [Rhodospirillales bacterium]|nr:DotA/TraY family protein [Rhodospirillales bacterium]
MNGAKVQGITGGDFLRYTLLPGIIPRLLRLLGTGFKTLAYYIAAILGAVRIFPATHPFLRRENFGAYGLITVLAEGARRVTWDRQHLDQVFIYLMILTGFVVLLLQFILMFLALTVGDAFAGNLINHTNDFNFFFEPSTAEQDYALRFLDMVFGLQNLAGTAGYFGSCVGLAGTKCLDISGNVLPDYATFPSAIHAGFHSMIEFYNYTIIGLAFVILFYYVVTMAAETTVHGSLWGQRGNKTWIPVRVIFFAALIMPFYQGFNLAQVITLNAAYYGTGMASNAWRSLNGAVGDNLAGKHEDLIAVPNRKNFPTSVGVVDFMAMVKTCKYAEQRINNHNIAAYIVKESVGGFDNCKPLSGTSYADALKFADNEDIRIRFGERIKYNEKTAINASDVGASIPCDVKTASAYAKMPTEYMVQSSYVLPLCGEITLTGSGNRALATEIRQVQYTMVSDLWADADVDEIGEKFTESALTAVNKFTPDLTKIKSLVDTLDGDLDKSIINAVKNLISSGYFDFEATLGQCGWMCAANYYERIANANGEVQGAIFNMPELTLWPSVTEVVLGQRASENIISNACEKFSPILPRRQPVNFKNERDLKVASAISSTHEYFCDQGLTQANYSDGGSDAFRYSMSAIKDNPVKAVIAGIFGVSGLFDMRENSDIHPLAQLSILGKGMVESTIRMFGGAVLGTMASYLGIEEVLGEGGQSIATMLSSIMSTFGMIGITIGFILYYVLPILPFIYFFFATASWVQAIFEAMVGLPLWALAHLRLDGEGIIGEAASSGYWLILEILIRPILILAGFMASISIFMAMVRVLNDSFDLVVANAGGFNASDSVLKATGGTSSYADPFDLKTYRNPIDQFFYTVIYAIIVYMLAMASFKLIDSIPNMILRWAGVSVKTFGDFVGDPSGELMSRVGDGIMLTAVMGGGLLGKVSARDAKTPTGSMVKSDDDHES